MTAAVEPKVDAGGAAAKTPPTVEVAVAAAQPPGCPHTGQACERGCTIPPNSGRVYCHAWVDWVRADEVSKRQAR